MKNYLRLAAPLFVLLLSLASCDQNKMPYELGEEGRPSVAEQGPILAGTAVGLERAMEVQNKHTPDLMAIPNVVGTAVGFGPDARPVVMVFTAMPGAAGIPASLEGIPVIPKVTGNIVALAKPEKVGSVNPASRFSRPVPIGVSTGHPDITAGTIGARVKNGANVYALSNNHVYADENKASLGDNVLQPGTYDGGTDPADAIGTLSGFKSLNFSGGDNVIDAAIALSSTGNLASSTPSDGYGRPKSATTQATINQRVMKYGRTTGLTKGKVYAINATVNVGYDQGVARFVGQIVIIPGTFSSGGDSGSLIVSDERGTNSRKPVGLLFAGSSTVTIANPIDAVLNNFGVTIDGE